MNKALIIGFPLLLILVAGGVAGAAYMGKINIPGLTPKKKKPVAISKDPRGGLLDKLITPVAKVVGKAMKDAEVAKKTAPPVKKVAAPVQQTDAGLTKLAAVWSEVEPDKLEEITKDWPVGELAKILAKMEDAKVAEYLALLKSPRSATISAAIKKEADAAALKAVTPTAG